MHIIHYKISLSKFPLAIFVVLLISCASPLPRHVNLMPAPEVYNDNGFTPFADDIVSYESSKLTIET